MITWDNFIWFVIPAAACWLAGALVSLRTDSRSKAALWLTLCGTLVSRVLLPVCGFPCSVLRCAPWVRPVCGILSSWVFREC